MSSITIEHLYKSFFYINSSAQIQLELEILRNPSTIFRSSCRRCSIKKLFWKKLYSKKNTCVGVSFLLKLQAFRPLTVSKKGLQHRYFPVNIGKFIRTPILKSIFERLLLHFWKLFYENILYSFATCLTAYHWNRHFKVVDSNLFELF